MPTATITIPHMLAGLIGGTRTHSVTGRTVGEAVASLFDRHQELRVHIYDESGVVRPHVLLFHNGTVVEGDPAIVDGDQLTVLQAVSGG